MKIGITFNLQEDAKQDQIISGGEEDAFEEFDKPETIEAIINALEKMGHKCIKLGFGTKAIEVLLKEKIDLVFNVAEGFCGRSREAIMPAIFEMLNVCYSGPDPLTASLTLDKIMAKRIASYAGVPTPSYIIINSDSANNYNKIKFPVIIKPAWEGSSKGIRQNSVVRNETDLVRIISSLRKNYSSQPLIAEQFIEGREFTVGVVGNEDPEIFGVMEIIPKEKSPENFVYSLEVKRNYLNSVEYKCPPDLNENTINKIERFSLQLYKFFGCRDVSRFDFRMGKNCIPYFIEANVLPGLNPVSSDLVIMAGLLKKSYDSLIEKIFNYAVERCKK